MTIFSVRATLVVFVATVAAVAAQHEPSAPLTFHSPSSDLVVLPVTVTDKAGRLISTLTRERFTIFDNNRPRPVTFFSREDTPVSLALVVDDSGSMRPKLGEVVAAATTFARLSNPDDEVLALTFNDTVHDALGGRRLAAADEGDLGKALGAAAPQGRTALYDALLVGLDRLDRTTPTRKVLVVISDGGDNPSRATLDEVLARARRSSVTIYAIGLFDPGDPDANTDVLKKLSTSSGGASFLPSSAGPLLQACHQIASEVRSSYTLGFEPLERDGTYHQLRVGVAGGDGRTMLVRTRPGYVAPARETP